MLADLPDRGETFIVHDLFEVIADLVPERDLFNVVGGEGLLGLHPLAGLGGRIILQPAVGVGHLGAEIVINDAHGVRVRIFQGFLLVFAGHEFAG